VGGNPSGPPALNSVVSDNRVALYLVFQAVCAFVLFLLALVFSVII